MSLKSSIITKTMPWCISIPADVRAVSQEELFLRISFSDFIWETHRSDWHDLLPEGQVFSVQLEHMDLACQLESLVFDEQGVDLYLRPISDQKLSHMAQYSELVEQFAAIS